MGIHKYHQGRSRSSVSVFSEKGEVQDIYEISGGHLDFTNTVVKLSNGGSLSLGCTSSDDGNFDLLYLFTNPDGEIKSSKIQNVSSISCITYAIRSNQGNNEIYVVGEIKINSQNKLLLGKIDE